MHIQCLGVAHVVGAPDPVDELPAGEHAPGIAQQHFQQFKLLQRKGHGLAVNGHNVPLHIHPDRAGMHRRGDQFLGFALPAQHGADARDELAGGIRLRDVVVGAELKPDHLVNFRILRRQHDDGHGGALAQVLAHLGAAHARQLQVQQHQVGAAAFKHNQGVQPVVRDLHLISLPAQQEGQGITDGLFVFDN